MYFHIEEAGFPLLGGHGTPVEEPLPHSSEFTSGLVVYLSGFMTVPHCFNYCSFVTCFETRKYKFPKVSKCFSFQYFDHVEYIDIAYEFQSEIFYSCLINNPPTTIWQCS